MQISGRTQIQMQAGLFGSHACFFLRVGHCPTPLVYQHSVTELM